MSALINEIESFLADYSDASPQTKSVMHDRHKSLCLAEVVFASLFYQDLGITVNEADKDFLLSKEPSLAAYQWIGCYAFCPGDPGNRTQVQVLQAEEDAVTNLADWIMADPEMALVCWRLAEQIAQSGKWEEEESTYDRMAALELMPMYEGYARPWFYELEGELQ